MCLRRQEFSLSSTVGRLAGLAPVRPLVALPPTPSGTLKARFEADGTLWQDSARTTPAAADADPVGAWDDAPGLAAANAVQATAGLRPALKRNRFAGRPTVLFTLATPTWLTFSSGGIAAGAMTYFCVVKPTGAGFRTMIAGAPGQCLQYRVSNLGKQELVNATVASIGAGNATLSATAAQVVSATWDGASAYSLRLNGADDGSGTNAQTVNGATGEIGARNSGVAEFFDGELGAVLVYTGVLSALDRTAVERYLGAKYGIAVV